ncbi:hypothetical protein OCU04_011226 [Sclerotinia nivalis]|uniref:Uncharacterized protein n=1 Tax=Sclerotinia nivalis TaxID=352851 RepID=A0A9X0AB19_9HELO|nr:hypothetical protein OCU04_011226 [Sclerotinia nivalis]
MAKTNAALKHIAHDTAKANKSPRAKIHSERFNGNLFEGKTPKSNLGTGTPADSDNLSMVVQRSTKSATTGDGRDSEQTESHRTPDDDIYKDQKVFDVHPPELLEERVHKGTSTEEEPFSDVGAKAHGNTMLPHQNFAKDLITQPSARVLHPKDEEGKVGVGTRNSSSLDKQIHINLSPAPARHSLDIYTPQPVNVLGDKLLDASTAQDWAIPKPNSSVYMGKEGLASKSSNKPSNSAHSEMSSPMFELGIKNGIRRLFTEIFSLLKE